MNIRHATVADASAIAEIYNYYVLHSTATYQEVPDTLEQRRAWLTDRKPEHPVIVGEENGEILGWASLSEFKGRSAYRYTVETSVYLRHGSTGKGLGTQLMRELISLGKRYDLRCILAVISADQEPSIRMHETMGFVRCGTLDRVGIKFGRWLDIALLQLHLEQ